MLRIALLIPQVLLCALIGYTLVTALWGWPKPKAAPEGRRAQAFVVVIPAHNEAGVIAAVIGDLLASDYPSYRFSTWVIADHCTDHTEAVASQAGAAVAVRADGAGGKGAALAWFLAQHPLVVGEVLVVLDADNRIPPTLLSRFSDELDAGATVVQAYLDTTRPEESWVSLASALSYWAGNRMVQLSRHKLGWSVDLGGTGMCVTKETLDVVGGFSGSLVEDQDLAVRLALASIPVTWLHDVRVRDEKPSTTAVVMRQRARWAAGKRQVARRYLGRLLWAGASLWRWRHIDQAIRLGQPSRMFVALISSVLAVVAAFTTSDLLLPWQVWTVAAAAQFIFPLPFLVRDGVPLRWVVRYPLLAGLAVLWIPIQILSRRVGGWTHTPHRGEV